MTLYECSDCGALYELPVEQTDGGVLEKECDECPSETLTDVSGLCERGRTFSFEPDADRCYNDAEDTWSNEAAGEHAETYRVCEDHNPEEMYA